ncbi:MAG: sugar isomerase [Candidatus Glassbacteria bacterium]|nr:sugar isomerase [Candidatus Glassbacteria bacterium]
MRIGAPLRVQPALIYRLRQRREATSWRRWGGIQTREDVGRESRAIERELKELAARADFPVEFLPVALVSTPEEGAAARKIDCDVQLAYWASGEYDNSRYEAFIDSGKPNVMFVRDESGTHYGGYLHAQSHMLRKKTDEYSQQGMDVWDVVVDDYGEVLWRLRALYGLKTMLGSRILAVGGASGWGPVAYEAGPRRAREVFGLDIVEIDYGELGRLLKKEMENGKTLEEAGSRARELVSGEGVSLHTQESFLVNSFVLAKVFKHLMKQYGCPAMTINECMGTIMPLSRTTACMPLSLINDEGLLAFCESDFAVIPACMLLRYISGRPVFLNDPCIPYNGVTTMAHCTCPRKLDGHNPEPVEILTHYESDYGAAPKVRMREGQVVTVIAPNFQATRWTGFSGKVVANTDHPICRSQVKVSVDGDWRKLREDMQGFHWAVCYGDYLRELGYALKKVGIRWQDLSTGRDGWA